jgi:hypothetical protein
MFFALSFSSGRKKATTQATASAFVGFFLAPTNHSTLSSSFRQHSPRRRRLLEEKRGSTVVCSTHQERQEAKV